MEVEHIAFNVAHPEAMANFYVEHLGLTIALKKTEPNLMIFLADDAGRSVLELYRNPKALIPKYAEKDPLEVHIAFKSVDAAADRDRLIAAGCTLESEVHPDPQSHLVMLRDPFGMPVQLCQRGVGLV